ncbi:hypothetical protein M1E17_18760 [Arthrobacter sp. D1-29]
MEAIGEQLAEHGGTALLTPAGTPAAAVSNSAKASDGGARHGGPSHLRAVPAGMAETAALTETVELAGLVSLLTPPLPEPVKLFV